MNSLILLLTFINIAAGGVLQKRLESCDSLKKTLRFQREKCTIKMYAK